MQPYSPETASFHYVVADSECQILNQKDDGTSLDSLIISIRTSLSAATQWKSKEWKATLGIGRGVGR